ncbi:AMP-binding protein [Streptomyces sp. NBC_01340]|nr:AMP-binding protein [Streptomyces sp. NBC_01719]MCX4498921.1 AMP-binding protein [Streptomyces sp. NBC_01728]WSI43374.1 AMP-binding protein [Streptomyces sp. NBC_01340]
MHLGWQAKRRPDAIAVIESGGRTVTYAELDARSRHLVVALDLKPEDAIAIRMPSGAAFLEVAWAAQSFGLRRMPVNTHITHLLPSEIDEMTEGDQLTAGPMGDPAAEDFLSLPRDPSGKLRKGLLARRVATRCSTWSRRPWRPTPRPPGRRSCVPWAYPRRPYGRCRRRWRRRRRRS